MIEKIFSIIVPISHKDIESLRENLNAVKYLDSLTIVEIVFALENEFNITFEEDDMANMKTINAIIEITERKIQ
jgi:acyl carrier protein